MSAAAVIRPAAAADLAAVRGLFTEYERFLGRSLSFQGFAEELAGLPGLYAPPTGALLIADTGGEAVGCVAVRPLGDGAAEMKRLYVRPAAHGRGLGRQLAEASMAAARERGYRVMRLDTFEWLTAAVALYRRLGFTPIAPYGAAPLPDLVYFERRL